MIGELIRENRFSGQKPVMLFSHLYEEEHRTQGHHIFKFLQFVYGVITPLNHVKSNIV